MSNISVPGTPRIALNPREKNKVEEIFIMKSEINFQKEINVMGIGSPGGGKR